MPRQFEDKPAVRERTPLLVGLMGPSGSGKTFSALRLASGIVKVTGGEIYVVDTEAGRSKHYADDFKFRHVEFKPPFGPLDYLDVLNHCTSRKAGVIIVDSMSHEHEGPGGVLEMHEAEVRRMAGDDHRKAEKIKMLAWSKPKQERRRLINTFLQMQTNFIFCFRAKEKVKLKPGEDPIQLGWMPIAGDEFLYEMTVNCLLYPASNGVPTWRPDFPGEKAMVKLPAQFRAIFSKPTPLSEEIGKALADWAMGARSGVFDKMARRIADAGTLAELEQLVPELTEIKNGKLLPAAEYRALREAYGERQKALEEYLAANPEDAEEPPSEPPPEQSSDAQESAAAG